MTADSEKGALPSSVTDAVLVPSNEMPEGSQKVEELDFNKFAGRDITVNDLINGMNNMGFQATSIGEAVRIINDMVPFPHFSPFCAPLFLLCPTPDETPYPSRLLANSPSSAQMERSRGLHNQNHNFSRLHLKPDLLRPPRHPPLPRPTLAHQRHSNNSRRHRRRPHKMPRRHLHGFLLHARRGTPFKRPQPNRKPNSPQQQLLPIRRLGGPNSRQDARGARSVEGYRRTDKLDAE